MRERWYIRERREERGDRGELREEREDICRIIGKFAHTTKRRIQIDQYFAEEFLDTLKKSRSQLPKEVLKRVIEFESAEKLNPPMEKRNKKILTQELIDKRVELNKEIQIRDIPQIDAKISFKDDNIKWLKKKKITSLEFDQ